MPAILDSRAFALLQQSMKDRYAFSICLAIQLMGTELWNVFEIWADDMLKEDGQ